MNNEELLNGIEYLLCLNLLGMSAIISMILYITTGNGVLKTAAIILMIVLFAIGIYNWGKDSNKN